MVPELWTSRIYIEHITKCCKCANEQFSHPYCTVLLYKIMHKIIVFGPNAMIFGRLVPGYSAVTICCQICNFGFNYGNINIFSQMTIFGNVRF